MIASENRFTIIMMMIIILFSNIYLDPPEINPVIVQLAGDTVARKVDDDRRTSL